ncbi:MAG TPA: carboxymuconolactone decarboxylase family protein [Ramlibacter sp.]|nr:carboxymuconolactone decarboxylase family protein [Ramlibacter sp.]
MTQEERVAADARIRALLGVNRKGTTADAPPMNPRAGSLLAVTASTKLPIDDETYGLQMYGYGEVWGRPGLPTRARSFITLGLLTGTTQPDQLGIHVNNAINLGLTPEEICETLVHVGAYSGVSTWHNGANVVRHVFVERGILQPGSGAGYVARPPTTRVDRQAAADTMIRALGVGRIGLSDDAPPLAPLPGDPASLRSIQCLPIEDDIEQIQNEYLYGEVWSRPTLDLRTRILITVAALQALRVNDALHASINVALNLGVTPDELHEVFLHAGVYSGLAGWRNATHVARDVFIQHGLLAAA